MNIRILRPPFRFLHYFHNSVLCHSSPFWRLLSAGEATHHCTGRLDLCAGHAFQVKVALQSSQALLVSVACCFTTEVCYVVLQKLQKDPSHILGQEEGTFHRVYLKRGRASFFPLF